MCFRIVQKLDTDWIGDDLLDCSELTVGYVSDELFAQEFCDKHDDCYYHSLHLIKYRIELEANRVDDYTVLEAVTIPIISPEE